ncbi:protein LDOC1-like [Ambystoma mexicanum]|uniref:protein LDOC1-like n=1 Tax=Ambystoma mexicanum TaxID=8296 RepID=UPI0037E95A93
MATTEQVQELLAAVQGLSLEVQGLKTENAVLRQMVFARQDRSMDLPSMGLASGKCDGSPKRIKEFIEACKVHFTFWPSTYAMDQACVGFMVSNITGKALACTTPLVTSSNPVLLDYGAFIELLKWTFQCPEVVFSAVKTLLDIRQGSSDLMSYITDC